MCNFEFRRKNSIQSQSIEATSDLFTISQQTLSLFTIEFIGQKHVEYPCTCLFPLSSYQNV